MSRRFFALDAVPCDRFMLSGDQAHHITNVMRFKPGERIVLFDGKGKEFPATIIETGKKKIILEVAQPTKADSPPTFELLLAVALPKGDRQKFMIEKIVELGATGLIPLKTSRGVSEANSKVITRIEKQVIEACKQCGRNSLMQIDTEATLEELNTRLATKSCQLLIATPGASMSLTELEINPSDKIVIAIGPEGGFSKDEHRFAIDNGWREIGLGKNILRIETAAIAATLLAGQNFRN